MSKITIDTDLCVICHAYGADKRLLKMRCFYAIEEVVPEMIFNKESGFYEAWICKSCRGSLLGRMKEWRDDRFKMRKAIKDHDGHIEGVDPNMNIPVRINGAVVMMTEEEYATHQANRKSNES